MDLGLLDRLETFFDAVPRDRATVETYGGLVLFVSGTQVPAFYGRPGRDGAPVSAADIADVWARQRALGLPEALEWVHDLNPGLIALAEDAGLAVLRAPLMVLDPDALPAGPGRPGAAGPAVRLLSTDTATLAADLAASDAVASIGFAPAAPHQDAAGQSSSRQRVAGAAQRDAACIPLSEERLLMESARLDAGLSARAVAETPDHGIAACGQYQRAGDVVEIVGVATLPATRRRGLASAVTVALARRARHDGAAVVFLSAAEEAVARIYARLGFRRIGTACVAEPRGVVSR